MSESTPLPSSDGSSSPGLKDFILQEAKDAGLLSGSHGSDEGEGQDIAGDSSSGTNTVQSDTHDDSSSGIPVDSTSSPTDINDMKENTGNITMSQFTMSPTDLEVQEEEMNDWIEGEMENWNEKNETNTESILSDTGDSSTPVDDSNTNDPTAPTDVVTEATDNTMSPTIAPVVIPTDPPSLGQTTLSPTTAEVKGNDKNDWIDQEIELSEPTIAPVVPIPQWNEAAPTFKIPTATKQNAIPPALAPAVAEACELIHYDECNPYVVLGVAGGLPLFLLCCLVCICKRCCCRPKQTDERGQYRMVAAQYGDMKYDNAFSDDYSDSSGGDIELSLAEMNG